MVIIWLLYGYNMVIILLLYGYYMVIIWLMIIIIWLVVETPTPLKNDGVRQ